MATFGQAVSGCLAGAGGQHDVQCPAVRPAEGAAGGEGGGMQG